MSLERALFVVLSLRVGGAERVTTTLLTHLAASRNIDLHLALIDDDGEFRRELPPEVRVHPIGTRSPAACLWRLGRLIRTLQPDVVFSTMFPVNVTVSLLKPWFPPQTRLVLREVNVLDALTGQNLRGRVLRRIAARSFPRADAVVCQSEFMRDDLCAGLRLDRDRTCLILNPIRFEHIRQLSITENPFADAGGGPHVLAAGQLMPKKGFDRLIAAAPGLLARLPDAQVWIIGEGRERPVLERQIAALGMQGRVHLPGVTGNPYCWMRHADLFVLSSRHEGTPNALLEAIACECPVVALDHPGGTGEVLGQLGLSHRIVDDLNAWSPEWFERPAPEVLAAARELLDAEHITERYLQVFQSAASAA
jgi:glycosyltransferase involved in cell wall biosynthesis